MNVPGVPFLVYRKVKLAVFGKMLDGMGGTIGESLRLCFAVERAPRKLFCQNREQPLAKAKLDSYLFASLKRKA
jgi:hypothetical protein